MPTTTGKATDFITFSRASNATVTDSDGKIKWAPHNLLTNSESFDASSWTKLVGATVTANTVAAPNGTLTADTINLSATANSRVEQTVSVLSGQPYTFTVWMRVASGTLSVRLYGLDGGTGSAFTVTTDWQQFSLTGTASAATRYPAMATDGTAGAVYAWGAHLYRSDMAMQANTSAYPMYNPTTPKNLLGYSEDFSNAAWVKARVTVTANSIVAPNGLLTADKISEDTNTGSHTVNQTGGTVGATETISFYAKPAGRNWALVQLGNGGLAYFDIQNGTVGTVVGGTASISSVGDGWFRCVFTAVRASNNSNFIYCTIANGTSSYTGDGTSGIYLWGAHLSDSASLDAYVPSYGAAVTSAAYYGPRRDFDPVTLGCKGLLVEEQRSNLFLRSDRFDATGSWTAANLTVTADTATAPDGTMTADTLAATAANGVIQQAASVTNAAVYTFSVWIKRKTGSGAVSLSDLNGNYFPVTVDSTWTRCTLTSTAASTTGRGYIRLTTSGDEVYIWGAQLEAGSFATSYIPTGSATATRSADVASVSTQAFPYGDASGSLIVSGSRFGGASYATLACLRNSADLNNRNPDMSLGTGPGGVAGIARLDVVAGGVAQAGLGEFGTFVSGTTYKVGYGYAANDFVTVVNAGTPNTDTSGTVPTTINTMDIGQRSNNGTTFLNGHIRQITYLPRRISNAELQSRTA